VFLIKVALAPVISRAVAVRAGVEDELDIGSGSHERLQSNHYTEQTIRLFQVNILLILSRIPTFRGQLGR
jgi:hypothetical protein